MQQKCIPTLQLIFNDYQISAGCDNLQKQKHGTDKQIPASFYIQNADFLIT